MIIRSITSLSKPISKPMRFTCVHKILSEHGLSCTCFPLLFRMACHLSRIPHSLSYSPSWSPCILNSFINFLNLGCVADGAIHSWYALQFLSNSWICITIPLKFVIFTSSCCTACESREANALIRYFLESSKCSVHKIPLSHLLLVSHSVQSDEIFTCCPVTEFDSKDAGIGLGVRQIWNEVQHNVESLWNVSWEVGFRLISITRVFLVSRHESNFDESNWIRFLKGTSLLQL